MFYLGSQIEEGKEEDQEEPGERIYKQRWNGEICIVEIGKIENYGMQDAENGDSCKKTRYIYIYQIYIDNVQMYSSSYKYNNVANMDSMMLSCFWLKLISMPLFTMCVVIHTQTSSITVFDPERSSRCACIDVSFVGESCMNSTKERIVHVHTKRYQNSAKYPV